MERAFFASCRLDGEVRRSIPYKILPNDHWGLFMRISNCLRADRSGFRRNSVSRGIKIWDKGHTILPKISRRVWTWSSSGWIRQERTKPENNSSQHFIHTSKLLFTKVEQVNHRNNTLSHNCSVFISNPHPSYPYPSSISSDRNKGNRKTKGTIKKNQDIQGITVTSTSQQGLKRTKIIKRRSPSTLEGTPPPK
jgi:hypothetical protein